MGPFFRRLAKDLRESGSIVHKINLNAGDHFFFDDENSADYTGTIESWPNYLKQHLIDRKVDAIYLFGDERSYHRAAHKVAQALAIDVYVFEEGYLRPHYITLEKDGVNGRSSIPRTPEAYEGFDKQSAKQAVPPPVSTPYSFCHMAGFATLYYLAGWLGSKKFPHYVHHRPFGPFTEMGIWLRAAFRKYYYRIRERHVLQKLTSQHSKQFFLAPLQVHNDAQIKTWSSVPSAAAFIRRIVSSFSKHAPEDSLLVIKHHPLDRGYSDYTRLINKLACKFNCKERVIYVHDLHLPTLLNHAKGTVLLNSTVGISSILHGTPVKTSGHAVYNMEGMTFQGKMMEFWKTPGEIDHKLNQRFRNYLITKNQINGNFYRRTPNFKSHTGIDIQHLSKLIQTSSEAPQAKKAARTIPTLTITASPAAVTNNIQPPPFGLTPVETGALLQQANHGQATARKL
ncbi:MAG: capsular biosynthesis protein [Gammaproteobacteria bacterium]|nr:capsular biosynthesis protein [Gammaproteobacteria bacterium]